MLPILWLKKVLCIRVLGGTRKRYARIGDIIVVTVKEAIPHAKVKKGDVLTMLWLYELLRLSDAPKTLLLSLMKTRQFS